MKLNMKNKLVLIRADRSGVHIGYLVYQEGREVHLSRARRIWSWKGALSVHEIANKGIDLKYSKISCETEEIILPTMIETHLVTKESNINELYKKIILA